jgi:MFS family permease
LHHDSATASPARAFGALYFRDFRLFWAGAIISHIGIWMEQVARNWLIYDLTGSALQVGLNGVFMTIPFVLTSLYAGTLVDRYDRRKLLLMIESANMAVVVVLAGLIVTGTIQIWHIYASSVVTAIIGAFESPARSTMLPLLVPRADLMTAISLNSMVRKGSQIIGPALGGLALGAFGVGPTYFLNVGTYVVLLAAISMLRVTTPVSERSQSSPIESLVEGIRYVRNDAVLGTLLVMEASVSIFGSFIPMMVVFAREVFQAGPQGYGLLQSALGAGSVLGSLAVASRGDVEHKGYMLIGSGLTFMCAWVAFALTPWFGLALLFLVIAGASDMVLGTTRTTMIQLLARRDLLGRVMSLHSVSTRGIGPFGGFQTGALAGLVGIQSAVAFGALIVGGITCLVALRAPAVRNFTGSGTRGPADGAPPTVPRAMRDADAVV